MKKFLPIVLNLFSFVLWVIVPHFLLTQGGYKLLIKNDKETGLGIISFAILILLVGYFNDHTDSFPEIERENEFLRDKIAQLENKNAPQGKLEAEIK